MQKCRVCKISLRVGAGLRRLTGVTECDASPDLASPGLRERKKRRTRQETHRAALELVHEHGLAGVTVEAIAERAGVSPRTFFNYWESKEAAVIGLDPATVDDITRALRERPADEPIPASLQCVLTEHILTATDQGELRHMRRAVLRADAHLMQMTHATIGALQTRIVEVLVDRETGQGVPVEEARPRAVVATAMAWSLIRAAMTIAFTEGCEVETAYQRARSIAAELSPLRV